MGVWPLRVDWCYTGGTTPSCLAVDNQPWVASSGSPLVRSQCRFASHYKVCVLFRSVQGLALGWCLEIFGGLGPSPTLLVGPSLPKQGAWRARPGGCHSQGCHGCPTIRLLCTGLSWLPYALGYCAPLSFQAPTPSSSIVDEFKSSTIKQFAKCVALDGTMRKIFKIQEFANSLLHLIFVSEWSGEISWKRSILHTLLIYLKRMDSLQKQVKVLALTLN